MPTRLLQAIPQFAAVNILNLLNDAPAPCRPEYKSTSHFWLFVSSTLSKCSASGTARHSLRYSVKSAGSLFACCARIRSRRAWQAFRIRKKRWSCQHPPFASGEHEDLVKIILDKYSTPVFVDVKLCISRFLLHDLTTNFLLPACPYDPGEHGFPIHDEAPVAMCKQNQNGQ